MQLDLLDCNLFRELECEPVTIDLIMHRNDNVHLRVDLHSSSLCQTHGPLHSNIIPVSVSKCRRSSLHRILPFLAFSHQSDSSAPSEVDRVSITDFVFVASAVSRLECIERMACDNTSVAVVLAQSCTFVEKGT